MAYSRSRKLTDSEKKLQMLKVQLWGKEPEELSKKPAPATQFSYPEASLNQTLSPQKTTEVNFLKNDLSKIGVLAAVIFTLQATIFFAVQRGLITL